MMHKALLILAVFVATSNARGCVQRSFGASSIVCVCNSTYCDETIDNDPVIPEDGSFYWYVSSKDGLRMNFTKGYFGDGKSSDESVFTDATLTLDSSKRFQKIHGFGGAFTDAAGINIKKLSPETQDKLIKSYFCMKGGNRYSFGRVPIAGSDFSTRPYTYDDFSGDTTLAHFALEKEDYKYKIPLMREALKLNPDVKFFAAAWTAPPWMKTNNDYNGIGFLKDDYYQPYTDYLLKFIGEYKKNGIDIWAISTGNEPSTNFVPFVKINSMGWTPKTQGKWVAENLGPTLANSPYNQTLILAIDDQRFNLPWYLDGMFKYEEAKGYIHGIAVHWYWDFMISPNRLDETQQKYPDKFLLMTEACTGSVIWDHPKVLLGSWNRGEKYMLNIIENINHWMTGWVDWNLALDVNGGPNWVENFVDAPIIVDDHTDEFYKQPMYYALKHFSRFVSPGSERISITDSRDIKSTAFATPAGEIVAVLYNRKSKEKRVTIKDVHRGNLHLQLPPYSMHTVIYKK